MQHGRTGSAGPKERLDGQHDPARRVNVRELLSNREFIKITAYLLPRRTKIRVLEMMERLRQERMPRRRKLATDKDVHLPEMTGGELIREINWRIGTLPPGDAEQVAHYIRHLTRWRAARTRERSRENATPTR